VVSSINFTTNIVDGQVIAFVNYYLNPSDPVPLSPSEIQNDYLGITRLPLPVDQATTEANLVNANTDTEVQFISGLLSQVANTTIPAVAVEASMYGAVGTSAEITNLVTACGTIRLKPAGLRM